MTDLLQYIQPCNKWVGCKEQKNICLTHNRNKKLIWVTEMLSKKFSLGFSLEPVGKKYLNSCGGNITSLGHLISASLYLWWLITITR